LGVEIATKLASILLGFFRQWRIEAWPPAAPEVLCLSPSLQYRVVDLRGGCTIDFMVTCREKICLGTEDSGMPAHRNTVAVSEVRADHVDLIADRRSR
jgi:hypothetical protein